MLQGRCSTLPFAVPFLLALTCVIAVGLSGCDSLESGTLAPGRKAPELELETLAGEPASLEQFRGKTILLNFLASWCAPCADEMPALEAVHQRLKDRGFTVVAVGVDDDLKALEAFREKHLVTFPFLVDKRGLSKKRYRLGGFPETYLLDSELRLKMFQENSMPTLKIVGPREWQSPEFINQFVADR